jgi:hypothetical protein
MILGKYIGSIVAISIALVSTKGDQPRTMTPCTPSIEPAITVTKANSQLEHKVPNSRELCIAQRELTEPDEVLEPSLVQA